MPAETELNPGRTARKAAGVFYTPVHIIDYILERTLARQDLVLNPMPKVLDPACGSGNFLVRAYDWLLAELTDKLPALRDRYAARQYRISDGRETALLDGGRYWCRENLHYHIITHCLYGADVDEPAVACAKTRLQAKKPGNWPGTATCNLLVGDSLFKWETAAGIAGAVHEDRRQQLAAFWSRQYDCVVGNPPYVSFGLNRVGKMTAGQAAYLRTHYPHSAQYKLSYYALFFERGILALRPGGFLGFITPDSYLLGRYYSRIRDYILNTCAIRELTLIEDKVFRGVLVGIPAITILQKNIAGQPAKPVSVNKLGCKGAAAISHQYSQDYFASQAYKRFRLFFNARDKAIIEKMEQAPYRFGDLTKIRTGMRSLTVQADIKSQSRQGDTWRPGLTSSAQVLPFTAVYREDWLDVNPEKLNKGGWDARIMAGAKIFLRQTGDRLIAAIDRSGLYHLNNIHSLTSLQAGLSLEYLACVLNSRLMNYYYHTVTLEKGRSMAQVDIETVEKLPLLFVLPQVEQVTAWGLQLEYFAGQLHKPVQAAQRGFDLRAEFTRLYNRMNHIIYDIYGLSAEEIGYIEQLDIHCGLAATGEPKKRSGRR